MDSPALHSDSLRPGPGTSQLGSKPLDLVRVLKRRRTLIVSTILLIVGACALVIVFVPPTYSATATLRADTDDDDQSGSSDSASIREAELRRQAQISTLIEVLRSRSLAQFVARDLALQDDPEFSPAAAAEKAGPTLWSKIKAQIGFGTPPPKRREARRKPLVNPLSAQAMKVPVDRLLDRLNIAQDGQSNLVNITVRAGTPAKAQRIANKVASNYIVAQIAQKRASNRRNVAALDVRVRELHDLLLKQTGAVESFKRAHGIDKGIGEDTGSVQMGRVASELAASRAGRAEAYARSQAGAAMKDGQSPLLTELRAQAATLERRSAELSTLYGRGHPDVRTVTAQLQQVRSDIAQESARVAAALRSEAAAQSAREGQLAGDLGALRSRSFSQNMASVQLNDLERDAETTNTLYVTLLSRLKQLRRQDNEFQADASISATALLPTEPSFPQPKKILAASLAGSVMFALLLAVIAEVMDHRVRTAEHVKALVGLETLGLVPELPPRADHLPPHLVVAAEPCSSFSETVRSILIELTRAKSPDESQVVLITSALPDEGKTIISASLAVAAARLGLNVALVDFDMRKPGLSRLIEDGGVPRDLADYLTGEAELDEVLLPVGAVPNLFMVPVADPPADPGRLLATSRMPQLLRLLRGRFDLVIVDTPPVLPVSDARSLAPHCDDALVVVRWSSTPPSALRAAVSRFGGEFSAAVINRVDYAKHMRLAYGDAIEHHARYVSYYLEGEARHRWWHRLRHWGRRTSGIGKGQQRSRTGADVDA